MFFIDGEAAPPCRDWFRRLFLGAWDFGGHPFSIGCTRSVVGEDAPEQSAVYRSLDRRYLYKVAARPSEHASQSPL